MKQRKITKIITLLIVLFALAVIGIFILKEKPVHTDTDSVIDSQIQVRDHKGDILSVDCQFKVTKEAADGMEGEVKIEGEKAGKAAIDTSVGGDLIIPETIKHGNKTYRVTEIGEYAFYKCVSLTGTGLEDNTTVTQIGASAFSGCESLTNVTLSENSAVTEIKNNAFYNCSGLAAFVIVGDTIPKMGETAFDGLSDDFAIYYPVRIDNGEITKVDNGKQIDNSIAAGSTVTIQAEPAQEKQIFAYWEVESGSVSLADEKQMTTTFAMPDAPKEVIRITSNYKDAPELPTDSKDSDEHSSGKVRKENDQRRQDETRLPGDKQQPNGSESAPVQKAQSQIRYTSASLDRIYDGQPTDVPDVETRGSNGEVSYTWYEKTNTPSESWVKLSAAPVNAGDYKVVATLAADKSHEGASVEKTFTIRKAQGTVTLPKDLEGVCGKTLSSISLSGGWHWKDETQTLTTDTDYYEAVWTVEDARNYDYSQESGYEESKGTITKSILVNVKPAGDLTVQFETKGGSAVKEQSGLAAGSLIKEPPEPVWEGHTFAGWYRDATCMSRWDFEQDRIEWNTILYAKWLEGEIRFEKISVLFDGSITLKFYATLPVDLDGSKSKVHFVQQREDQTNKETDQPGTWESDGSYSYLYSVSAEEMTDPVQAQLTAVTDDGYVFTRTIDEAWTVEDYVKRLLDIGGTDAEDAVKAMLRYGAAVQERFGYRTESLADRSLSLEDKAVPEIDPEELKEYKMTLSGEYSGETKFTAATLMLEGANRVRTFFVIDERVNADEVIAECEMPDGTIRNLKIQQSDTGEYYADTPEISVGNLDAMLSITLKHNGQPISQTLKYGPYSDIYRQLSTDGAPSSVKRVYNALVDLDEKTRAYGNNELPAILIK